MSADDERTYARAVPSWMRPGARPVRRAVQLLIGLVLYAASIAMLVDAGLGSMPWDVLTQGIVRRTGLSFGVVTLLTGLVASVMRMPIASGSPSSSARNGSTSALITTMFATVPTPGR